MTYDIDPNTGLVAVAPDQLWFVGKRYISLLRREEDTEWKPAPYSPGISTNYEEWERQVHNRLDIGGGSWVTECRRVVAEVIPYGFMHMRSRPRYEIEIRRTETLSVVQMHAYEEDTTEATALDRVIDVWEEYQARLKDEATYGLYPPLKLGAS